MRIRRTLAVIGCLAIAGVGLTGGRAVAASHPQGLSRPMIHVHAGARPASTPDGISVNYSTNWSGYAALPKTSGQQFTSIVANYNVPSVQCKRTPNTFSYHWIGLDGWADATVEQDGIAADCSKTNAQYFAWYEMYPAPFRFSFRVNPGDSIESSVRYVGQNKYELSLKDVSTGRGFDVTRPCPVDSCENSSAEAITEAYYFDKQFSGTSDFGDEHYEGVTLTDNGGHTGGLSDPKAWRTGEGIALGEYGDVDTTPGPLASIHGLGASSAFSVFWSRQN